MNIADLATIYGVIFAFVTGIGTLLHNVLNDDVQQPLKDSLRNIVRRHPHRWVRKTNVAFNRLFDRIFAAKKTPLEDSMWMGLLLSPIFLCSIKLIDETSQNRITVVSTASSSMLLAIALAFSLSFGTYIGRKIEKLASHLSSLVGFATILIFSILFDFGILFSIGFGLGFGISFGSFFTFRRLMISYMGLKFSILNVLLIIVVVVLGFTIGNPISVSIVFVSVYCILYFFCKGYRVPVNPFYALWTSVLFMILLATVSCLVNLDVPNTFLIEWNNAGPSLLVFFGFNIFADSVSLWETRWVLRWGLKASWYSLFGLLGLDLLLSAAIFLFLPLVLGELPAFLEAALFRGDRAWLGVLFWTTFSTSIIFYLFVLSSLLVRPLSRMPKLGRHLQVEKRPVLVLTLAAVIVVTVLFWGGVGIAAIIT